VSLYDRGLTHLLHGELHRLHVPERTYKLGTTVYRCLQNKAPSYLVAACTLVADVASEQYPFSASRHRLVVPRHRCTTLGRRAFSVVGPMVWNALTTSEIRRWDAKSRNTGLFFPSALEAFYHDYALYNLLLTLTLTLHATLQSPNTIYRVKLLIEAPGFY